MPRTEVSKRARKPTSSSVRRPRIFSLSTARRQRWLSCSVPQSPSPFHTEYANAVQQKFLEEEDSPAPTNTAIDLLVPFERLEQTEPSLVVEEGITDLTLEGGLKPTLLVMVLMRSWKISALHNRCMLAWFRLSDYHSAPCVSYLLRKRALYDDMSRYTCCGGYMPCSGKCGESKCPEFCLCTEVFLCFANSVASTRFMLQDEFNIQTTPCDNCIIGFMLCLQQLACIFSLVACITGIDELQEASQILSCFSDLVYCTVCACMQTQHKVEMDKRDGKFGPPPVMAVPPAQHIHTQQVQHIDAAYIPLSVCLSPLPLASPPSLLA
ncbi:hypothetical protein TEA_001260 [Camellia sinensis var. sinensis]|uniref:PLAC8 family protein n=1 Tax=Camellia sinensis var. sinensis TaxID=542762 RepID=A0A4S4EYN5_CAMSN|nr:hypothetical protein TEA_001260 [Camellia sinensis var. sinensis]